MIPYICLTSKWWFQSQSVFIIFLCSLCHSVYVPFPGLPRIWTVPEISNFYLFVCFCCVCVCLFFCKRLDNILGFVDTTQSLLHILLYLLFACLLVLQPLKYIKTSVSLWAIQSLSMGWISLWDVVFPTWFIESLVLKDSAVLHGICSAHGKLKTTLEILIEAQTELQDRGIKQPLPRISFTLWIPGTTGSWSWKKYDSKNTILWFQ